MGAAGALVGGFPAHAGMDRGERDDRSMRAGLPRTRGDGPRIVGRINPLLGASPHTRGWTRRRRPVRCRLRGFPAHAGMDRR